VYPVLVSGVFLPDRFVHRADELAQDERRILERWLGRPIGNDETISLNVYRPHDAPGSGTRAELRHEILQQAKETGTRGQGMSESEIDALVDDAIAATRRSHRSDSF